MKKGLEQTEMTRRRIVDAFWELYEKTPIEKITVKEIVSLAQCNRSTFYQYFDSVYEVLQSIEDGVFLSMEQMFKEVPEHPSYEEIITYQIDNFETEGKYLSVLVSESGNPVFAKRIRDLFSEKIRHEIPSDLTPEQAAFIAEYTSGGFSAIMTKWLREGRRFPLTDLLTISHFFQEAEVKLLLGEVSLQ